MDTLHETPAERALADATDAATSIPDLPTRSRAIADLERVVAEAARNLGAARVDTYRARLAAGETQASLAASEGVSQQRIQRLIARRPVRDATAVHRAAVAARTARDREARDAETAAWLERVDAGKTTPDRIADRTGISLRTVRSRLAAARAARDDTIGDGAVQEPADA